MNHWLSELESMLEKQESVVRIVVARVRGSAPREPGTSMLVQRHTSVGSIGGGNLEYQALKQARRMLESRESNGCYQRFILGADVAQCCGGMMDLWWEKYDYRHLGLIRCALQSINDGAAMAWMSGRHGYALVDRGGTVIFRTGTGEFRQPLQDDRNDRNYHENVYFQPDPEPLLIQWLGRHDVSLWLYGAGHVGRALVSKLAGLPFDITWVDDRPDAFAAGVPSHVTPLLAVDPAQTVAMAPSKAWFVILTHSHHLDFSICYQILGRPLAPFVGLIGSRSKSARFARRLAQAGIPGSKINALICPIGIAGIGDKSPAVIAISITAQLLQKREERGAGTENCSQQSLEICNQVSL